MERINYVYGAKDYLVSLSSILVEKKIMNWIDIGGRT